jgi:preprotein translocase subunit YajC
LLFAGKSSTNAARPRPPAAIVEDQPMFISPAYAQALGDSTNSIMSIAPLVLIFVVFYFFLIRPQQKKQKEHRAMLDALRRGDRVVTGGGIIGTVAKVVNQEEVLVDIAENTRIRIVRGTIASVLAKTEPVAAKETAKGEAAKAKGDEEKEPATADAGDKGKRKGGGLGDGLRRMMGGK